MQERWETHECFVQNVQELCYGNEVSTYADFYVKPL